MQMTCQLSAQEVYLLIGEELTKRGLKWIELKAQIDPSMVFDMKDTFGGMTFQLEVETKP